MLFADLLGDARAAVAGILVLRERCPLEVPDLVVLALIGVRHARLQPVDVGPRRFERQIPEHVVERPVLEHEHDDVVDLAEVGEGRVGRSRCGLCARALAIGQKRSDTWSATSLGRFFSAASVSTKWSSSNTVSGSRVSGTSRSESGVARCEAVHHRRQVAVRTGEMRPLIDAVVLLVVEHEERVLVGLELSACPRLWRARAAGAARPRAGRSPLSGSALPMTGSPLGWIEIEEAGSAPDRARLRLSRRLAQAAFA